MSELYFVCAVRHHRGRVGLVQEVPEEDPGGALDKEEVAAKVALLPAEASLLRGDHPLDQADQVGGVLSVPADRPADQGQPRHRRHR